MKELKRKKQFTKHFLQRISANKKLMIQFEQRLQIFLLGERHLLYDHALTGTMLGKRAFSIAHDCRVVYEETDSTIILLDIGSHNQVYGK